MTLVCLVSPRVTATLAVAAGLVILWSVVRGTRRHKLPPRGVWENSVRHFGRLALTPAAVGIYLIAMFQVSSDLFRAEALASLDRARCEYERIWSRSIVYSVGMMLWMLFASLPFLRRPQWQFLPRARHRALKVLGVSLGLVALATIAFKLRPGFRPDVLLLLASYFLARQVAATFDWSRQLERLKAARKAVLFTVWPTLLIPTISGYAQIVTIAFTIGITVLLVLTLDPQPVLRDVRWRDRWSYMEGDSYLNTKHGVLLSGLNDWIVQPIDSDFDANGGFLSLENPERTVALSIASGPLDVSARAPGQTQSDSAIAGSWKAEWLARLASECAPPDAASAVKPLLEIDGERHVLRHECKRGSETVGRILALHGSDEYELSYILRADARAGVSAILQQWKWLQRLPARDTGLRYRSAYAGSPARPQQASGSVTLRWFIQSSVAAMTLFACGAVVGSVFGFHICAMFFADSPASFMERPDELLTDIMALGVSAYVGGVVFLKVGFELYVDQFWSNDPPWTIRPKPRSRPQSVLLGVACGTCAGALSGALFWLAAALTFVGEPTTADSPWAVSPYRVVPVEMAFGAVPGLLVGLIIALLLAPPRTTALRSGVRQLARNITDVSWLRYIGHGTLGGAAMMGVTVLGLWQFLGPVYRPLVMAVSTGVFYFPVLALFIRFLYLVFRHDFIAQDTALRDGQLIAPLSSLEQVLAAHDSAKKRASRWAIAGGAVCGGTIGLRLAIYAEVVDLEPAIWVLRLMVVIGALLGAYLGMYLGIIGPRLKLPPDVLDLGQPNEQPSTLTHA